MQNNEIPEFNKNDSLQDFRQEKTTHEGLLDTQKEYLLDED